MAKRLSLCFLLILAFQTSSIAQGQGLANTSERGLLYERAITEPVPLLVSGERTWPAVATNGVDYLVVWTDVSGGESSIFAAPVRDGETEARPAVYVGPGQRAWVEWTGNEYLILSAYLQLRHLHRMSSDGAYLGAVPLDNVPGILGGALFASNGGRVLVGPQFPFATSTLFDSVFLVDSRGSLVRTSIDASRVAIATPYGENFLVVQRMPGNSTDSTFLLIDRDGKRVSESVLYYSDAYERAIASNGTEVLLLLAGQTRVEARLLGPSLSPAGSLNLGPGSSPDVAWDGAAFLATWIAEGRLFAARISARGELLTPATALTPAGSQLLLRQDSASNGRTTLLLWTEQTQSRYPASGALRASFIKGTSTVGSNLEIETFSSIGRILAPQHVPAVAIGPQSDLITWREVSGPTGKANLMGRVIPHERRMPAPPPFVVSTRPGPLDSAAAVAGHAEGFVIAWEQEGELLTRQVSADGFLLDDRLFNVGLIAGARPVIEWNGDHFLLVWPFSGIRGLKLDRDGAPIGTSIRISESGRNPAISTINGSWYVSWEDGPSGGCSLSACTAPPPVPSGIFVVRVSGEGIVLDSMPLIASPAGAKPSTATDGRELLVTWNVFDPLRRTHVLQYRRLSADGTWIDGYQRSLNIPFLWQDSRQISMWNGSAWRLLWTAFSVDGPQLFMATLTFGPSDATLGLVELSALLVQPNYVQNVQLDAHAANARTLIAYARSSLPSPFGRMRRVYYRSTSTPTRGRRVSR